MRKVLTTLLLAVSLAGVYTTADASAALRQTGAQSASGFNGSLHTLVLQRNRRRRIIRRIRWNRGRTDNTWNNGRRNRNWNRARWNRGRRGNRGGHDHE
jgi:hypothetical protein